MKKLVTTILMAILILALVGYAEEVPASANSYNVGDSFCLGHYEQDGYAVNGKEPISWKVLSIENDKALVMSEKGLRGLSYGTADMASYSDRDLSWGTSYLREWLNNDFLKSAFAEDERACILRSRVITLDAAGTCATDDYLFCLSIDEAERYFDSKEAMGCEITEVAKKGLRLDAGAITDGYGCWWLRDLTNRIDYRGDGVNEAAYISGISGTQNAKKGKGMPVFCDYLCTVRPAMWVDLTNEKLYDGPSEENISVDDAIESSAQVYITLEKGAKGDEVKALQERLNELNYVTGSADGIFGNKTGDAVVLFQKINGLEATGVADELTQRSLYAETAVCNLEGLKGVSIVDRIASLLAGRGDAIEYTETYTYERYTYLEDYFAAFGISDPENVSVSNWYFSYDKDGLTAYDEWKYIHVTYPTKGSAEQALKGLQWTYKMFVETIPDLIEEAADKGYSIVSMDYFGKDMTDDEVRREGAVICEGEIAQMQSIADTQKAFESVDKNGDGKISFEELLPVS